MEGLGSRLEGLVNIGARYIRITGHGNGNFSRILGILLGYYTARVSRRNPNS